MISGHDGGTEKGGYNSEGGEASLGDVRGTGDHKKND